MRNREREREIFSYICFFFKSENCSFIKSQDECRAADGLWTNHESYVGQNRGETHNTKPAKGETLGLGSVFLFLFFRKVQVSVKSGKIKKGYDGGFIILTLFSHPKSDK